MRARRVGHELRRFVTEHDVPREADERMPWRWAFESLHHSLHNLVRHDRLSLWGVVLSRWIQNWTARWRLLRCDEIDPRFAKDVGLTFTDIEIERRSPFWLLIKHR